MFETLQPDIQNIKLFDKTRHIAELLTNLPYPQRIRITDSMFCNLSIDSIHIHMYNLCNTNI